MVLVFVLKDFGVEDAENIVHGYINIRIVNITKNIDYPYHMLLMLL